MHHVHGSEISTTGQLGSSLIGRDETVDLVMQLVRRPDVRLVTVTGRSGVGKSVVAATVARKIELEDGIGIARAQVDRHGTVAGADEIRAALTAPTDGPAGPPPVGRRRVVLLDGLEAVSGAPELVDAGLASDTGLTVLTTSIVPLGLPGEQVVRLGPLPLPSVDDPIETQLRAPAVHLLLTRIAEAGEAAGCRVDPPAAVALARLLDGLPLALELAAARCAELSIAEVLDQVERLSPTEVLHTDGASREPHHRSLRETILWTYGLLDDDARAVLRRLGVFAGPFGRDDAAAVAGADGDQLDKLVVAGLARRMTVITADQRFELVPSVSHVARELLAEDDELLAAEDRHAEHFLAMAAAVAPVLRSPAMPEVRRKLRASIDDVVAAVRHLERRDRRGDALRLLIELALVWEESGPSALAAQLLEELLPDSAGDAAVDPSTWAQAWALGAMVTVFGRRPLRRSDELREALVRALEVARGDAAPLTRWVVLRSQVTYFLVAGEPAAAATAAEEGLELALELDHTWWVCQFLGSCAAARAMLGDRDGARSLAIEGRDLALLHGDSIQLLRLSHLLVGISGLDPQEPGAALPEQDLIALARRVDDVHAEGVLRVGRAVLDAATGDVASSAAHLLAALDLGRQRDLWYVEELALVALVMLTMLGGRPEDAACVHGSLTDELPRIERSLAPELMQMYGAAVERARVTLGDTPFERAVARGRLLERNDATDLAAAVCNELSAADQPATPTQSVVGLLSPRQSEVLARIARGQTNKEIATALGMRPKTVMHHTSEIYRRLGVRNRTEAVAAAHRLGIIDSFD